MRSKRIKIWCATIQFFQLLLMTLRDDSDFEVCKASAQIIIKLKKILIQYKIDMPLSQLPQAKNNAVIDTNYVKQIQNTETFNSSRISSNDSSKVIDDIVNAVDTDLLALIYGESMKVDMNVNHEQQSLQKVRSISKEEFLRTIFNTDIENEIKEKDHWLKNYNSSFESTLDDILNIYEQKDMNSMDCY